MRQITAQVDITTVRGHQQGRVAPDNASPGGITLCSNWREPRKIPINPFLLANKRRVRKSRTCQALFVLRHQPRQPSLVLRFEVALGGGVLRCGGRQPPVPAGRPRQAGIACHVMDTTVTITMIHERV